MTEKRRRRKKSKFKSNKFKIHASSRSLDISSSEFESEATWEDVEETEVTDDIFTEIPQVGYLDENTGEFIECYDEDDDRIERNETESILVTEPNFTEDSEHRTQASELSDNDASKNIQVCEEPALKAAENTSLSGTAENTASSEISENTEASEASRYNSDQGAVGGASDNNAESGASDNTSVSGASNNTAVSEASENNAASDATQDNSVRSAVSRASDNPAVSEAYEKTAVSGASENTAVREGSENTSVSEASENAAASEASQDTLVQRVVGTDRTRKKVPGDPLLVLPEEKTLRMNRSRISAYAEKGVAELVLEHDTVLHADGTSRGWIRSGKCFTTPLKVNGRNRRLPIMMLSNETRDNLKNTIIHLLEKLSIVSSSDKITLWKQIVSFVADKASENPGLMKEIADELGITHTPGEFFCLIHTVLGFDRDESSYFLKIQKQVGVTKLFANLNYVDLDSDSFDAVKSSLDCTLRLISPQFSHKSWSRYKKFCDYCEQSGFSNNAFAMKEQIFGQTCASAAVAVYYWNHLESMLSTSQSESGDRNQLACAVRAILKSPVVKFLIVSKALCGIILQEPFVNMVVEQHITRSQLLIVLPALFEELKSPPGDVLDISKPALPSLTSSWLPYCYPRPQVAASLYT